jgi:ABC-type Fe3+/spermidine/putrescine transport system ATPase subunit
MNVSANVAFGLRMQNLPMLDQQIRVRQMLDLVGLAGFDKRDVTHLSGGERQRVALARSLAPNPRLLMLDEPLGSLDAALREDLIIDLRTIIKQLHLTAIYVTHDQHEAFAVADRIAVMNAGHVEQFDIPTKLYQQPSTAFVAHFLGLDNVVPVKTQQNDLAVTAIGSFPVTTFANNLLLHTDFLTIVPSSNPETIPATLVQLVFQGDSYRLTLRHDSGTILTVKYPSSSLVPQVGDRLAIQIAPNAIIPLAG